MKQILVPVDGSELSERALPYAALLAKAQASSVTVVRVLEPAIWATTADDGYMDPQTYDQMVGAIRGEARDNLDRNRGTLQAAGIAVEAELIEGLSAGGGLLDLETRLAPDLVVMATHGRTGLARFALGSIADRLVREGSAPVLLIPAFAEEEPRLARALVPLDGSRLAEQALSLVEALAGKPLTSVKLLTALNSEEPRMAGSVATNSTDVANEYLQEIAGRLAKLGLSTDVTVSEEEAPEAIEHASTDIDVVIMSTHGRGGLDRWRHGSVAERAARHVAVPRLLVRAR